MPGRWTYVGCSCASNCWRFDPVIDFDGAATIYRSCRQVGVTPGGLVDCMIASVALRHGASLLVQDADLRRVAEVIGLELDAGSAPR